MCVGLLLLAAYVLVFRWDLAPLPVSVAVVVSLGAVAEALARPYPGALAAGLLAAAVIALSQMLSPRLFHGPAPSEGGVRS